MVARIELGVLEQGVEQEAERVYFVEELFLLAWQKGNIPCQLTILRAGAEAIDYLLPSGEYKRRDPADDPDLIVLDLKIPKMDGLKLLKVPRVVRDRHGHGLSLAPIVLFTSSNQVDEIRDAYRHGAYSFVRKPVNVEGFVRTVQETIRYWFNINEQPPKVRLERVPPGHSKAAMPCAGGAMLSRATSSRAGPVRAQWQIGACDA